MLKKVFVLFLCCTILISSCFCVYAYEKTEISDNSQSSVLYCVNDGKSYYAKDENRKMKNASTTKIMTALITLEEAQIDNKQVEFTKAMESEGSLMYLKLGDVVTLYDLAVGMLTCSGNDAANAAAIAISGSSEAFAEKMNIRAKQLGIKNTNFVTPSGLDDENHYSTAYDLALLMAYALNNEDFAKITSQRSVDVNFVKPENHMTTYTNHNRLLSLYEYCIGGKTGYTKSAGRCLVSAAEKDGLKFVCVTLNDKTDWNDHQSIFEYGFNNYSCLSCDDTEFYLEVPTAGGDTQSVTVGSDRKYNIVITKADEENVQRTVYLDNFLYSPVNDGDLLGKVVYTINNSVVAENPLVALSYSK